MIQGETTPATRPRLEEDDGRCWYVRKGGGNGGRGGVGVEASCGVLHRPHARWRELGLHVNFVPILDQEAVDIVQRVAFSDFQQCYDLAVEEERERVQARLKQLELGKKGKRPTSRPTDKAYKV